MVNLVDVAPVSEVVVFGAHLRTISALSTPLVRSLGVPIDLEFDLRTCTSLTKSLSLSDS